MRRPITELQGTVTSNGCVEDSKSPKRAGKPHKRWTWRGLGVGVEAAGEGLGNPRKPGYQGGVEVMEGQQQ